MAMSNRSLLANTQAHIMQIRDINIGKEVLTIATLQATKIGDIIQDEEHSLQVTVPGTEFAQLHAYVGCSQCGKTTTTPLGKQFAFTLCHNRACTSSPRVTFKCDLDDNTGTLPVTLFTDNCEKIFGMSAADIFRMRLDEDEVAFAGVQECLEASTIVVKVTPSTELTRNRVLQWVLNDITLNKERVDAETTKATPNNSDDQTLSDPIKEPQVLLPLLHSSDAPLLSQETHSPIEKENTSGVVSSVVQDGSTTK